jgi:polyphosphate kinase 2 (PPK2 family)
MSNIASLITMKYISEQEYEESLEKLAEALIKWQEKGYLLQEYFCYITEEFQRERLYGRRNNPKKSHKFSPSDEKAMELYSEIS